MRRLIMLKVKGILRFVVQYVLVSLVILGFIALYIFAGANFRGEGYAIRLPERLSNINEQCWTLEEVAEKYQCKGRSN